MGGCHPLDECMVAVERLPVEELWSALRSAIFLLSCTNRCRKRFFHLVGTPFLTFLVSPEERSLVRGLLTNEWV